MSHSRLSIATSSSKKSSQMAMSVHLTTILHLLIGILTIPSIVLSFNGYLETYPPVPDPEQNESRQPTPLYFGLIMSFPGGEFDSSGAIAGVKVALDRINSDPTVLPNHTLHYTLTNSSVSS